MKRMKDVFLNKNFKSVVIMPDKEEFEMGHTLMMSTIAGMFSVLDMCTSLTITLFCALLPNVFVMVGFFVCFNWNR